MRRDLNANRRTVLIAACAAAASTGALAGNPGIGTAQAAVFEAEEPAARAFVRGRPGALAVDGDRVRFARRLFREQRPTKVVAVTRYADFLLLAESAREEGYRTALVAGARPGGPALFVWTAERA